MDLYRPLDWLGVEPIVPRSSKCKGWHVDLKISLGMQQESPAVCLAHLRMALKDLGHNAKDLTWRMKGEWKVEKK